jgi:hypothetical protein
MNPFSDDQPEPTEQPLRARVPDHVVGGCFSTGVIVVAAQTEFILDFVQNLGRPHQIVARVVLPHSVLPQLVDALSRNIALYRGRWGSLPDPQLVGSQPQPSNVPPGAVNAGAVNPGAVPPGFVSPSMARPVEQAAGPGEYPQAPPSPADASLRSGMGSGVSDASGQTPGGPAPTAGSGSVGEHQPAQPVRQATAQEIYDDLKIRDELLSGVYANAVMIGHGPHEFSFDFITNFYPHSAVSARVFLAAGQIPRLFDSLKGTWDQLRHRNQPPQ